jgi:DNA-binding Xre family transcriptional regulator
MVIRLRLRELLESRSINQAELGRRAGMREERVSRLVRNGWMEIKRDEIGRLLKVLRATPEELFEVHEPNVFFGARWDGPLQIHVSARRMVPHERSAVRPHRKRAARAPLGFNSRDIEALKLIQDRTRKLGIASEFVMHTPDTTRAARPMDLFDSGSHVIIGSNMTGELSEYAVAHMYGAPAFDELYLKRFPFNFSWGANRSFESSFGFDGPARNLPEGIYSTREKKIVATRTHKLGGLGEDCGLIIVYRVESPSGDDPRGVRRERCLTVLAGHGRHGTLGCARLLVDPEHEARLYPEKERKAKMFAVQVEYFRQPESPISMGQDVSELRDVRIVAEV